MNRQEFNNLRVGQWVVDREYNTYGEVKEGPWKNVGILNVKTGNGKYIVWDDGDMSEVGVELHTDEEIEKFELSDIVPT